MARKVNSVKIGEVRMRTPELLHVSFDENLPRTLKPQLPAGMDDAHSTKKEKPGKYPEPDDVERTSFSQTLEGCVQATYPNWYHYFEDKKYNYPYVDMWLYRAKLKRGDELIIPGELGRDRLVWDAVANKEYWVLNSVEVERIGKIRVWNANKEGPRLIHPFGDKDAPLVEAGPEKFRIERIGEHGLLHRFK